MKCLIIAEAGVNHNANLNLAFKMVDVALEAGVDVIKFQTAVPEEVVTKFAKKAKYQINDKSKETQLEMTKKLHLPLNDYYKLVEYCELNNIKFATTAFDLISLDFILKLNLPFLKIPSGEITNLPYLRKIRESNLPLIISTGMATIDEIEETLNVFKNDGKFSNSITLLHCTTSYPTPVEEVNLKAMTTMRQKFNTEIGYSDHTLGIEVSLAAVALGATVIEKHFTLDKNLDGPDHKASLEPRELNKLVQGIRKVEKAFGTDIKKPTACEVENIEIVRKSIVAKEKINKGDLFTWRNLTVKRPGNGISPMKWDSIINQVAKRSYEPDELIVD